MTNSHHGFLKPASRGVVASARVLAWSAFGLALAACGGGAHAVPSGAPVSNLVPASQASLNPTTVTLTIPAPGSGAATANARRSPAYIPASTASVAFALTAASAFTVTAPLVQTANVAPGSGSCGAVSGADYTCTLKIGLPAGTDTLRIGAYDGAGGSGHLLSQQIKSVTVAAGANNSIAAITLDGNPGSVTVAGLSGPTGTYPNFTVNGTASATFTLGNLDTHGTAFGSQPNVPTITHAAATSGASVSISGTTLTLTPPSSGGSTNVVVSADPAGTLSTTTLSSPANAGATSLTVTSAANITVGQNLTLDYETFNSGTLAQENVTVASISATTIGITSALKITHASGAIVRGYSDGLAPAFASFTVTIANTLIAPVASNGSPLSKALVYNTTPTLQTGFLTSTTASYDYARFDTSDQLFIADQNLEDVLRSNYTAGTGFGAVTTYSGIPNQGGNFGFDVSSSGVVLVENSAGVAPQLDIYPAGANLPATFTSGLGNSTFNTVTEFLYPTAAVLADGSGNVFGYAYSLYDLTTATRDRIVVTAGSNGPEQDITAATSTFNNDAGSGVMTWNVGRQSLIYANSESPFAVLEYPRSGTSGAMLSTSPTTVTASLPAYPVSVAASRDGAYVAVAYTGPSGVQVNVYHNGGAGWSLASGASSLASATFASFTAIHFLPSDNLVVTNSNGGAGAFADIATYSPAGALVSSYNAQSDFGANYVVNDFAVSF